MTRAQQRVAVGGRERPSSQLRVGVVVGPSWGPQEDHSPKRGTRPNSGWLWAAGSGLRPAM